VETTEQLHYLVIWMVSWK